MHDDFGQQLVALKIACARVDASIKGSDSPAGAADLANVYKLIDQLVAHRLIPALEWLVNRFSEQHGVRVSHRIVDNIDFNDDRDTAVFRIVQEALTNVARHARATEVVLEILRKRPH
ncbi:signal transduction histidine kinase [Paraburkholderia youngii]|uniref:sensor histidine kinase n=1 Tax=Paraburkholderia youngii TaxID=2782701 RepID=UPI003D254C63